jgi:hypothetical protein
MVIAIEISRFASSLAQIQYLNSKYLLTQIARMTTSRNGHDGPWHANGDERTVAVLAGTLMAHRQEHTNGHSVEPPHRYHGYKPAHRVESSQ